MLLPELRIRAGQVHSWEVDKYQEGLPSIVVAGQSTCTYNDQAHGNACFKSAGKLFLAQAAKGGS
jgi:hypothetical protein